ncbi:hypothetical protein [Amycolatopsis taiwanensis]|uniref:hypothetical protein n=1 Tax=Amycolatopsis taiwanensis TaxID=342230 RepID=UPI0005C2296D|nr:hypothetical protein [Amycolatopsis taiwanensis]
MSDLIETLASEGGKELVKALAAGFGGLVKKAIPALWRRSGSETEKRMAAELDRSAAELAAASERGDDRALLRVEAMWETRLRDLLAASPAARRELEAILDDLRRQAPPEPKIVQHVVADGSHSTAQGVIGGAINNYAAPSGEGAAEERGGAPLDQP